MNFRTIVERRKILLQNMTPIKGHIMFSEVKELHVSIIFQIAQSCKIMTYIIIFFKIYFRILKNLS